MNTKKPNLKIIYQAIDFPSKLGGRIELATAASSVHFHFMLLHLISSFHSNPQLKQSF